MKTRRAIFLCVLVVALVIGVFSIKREQGKPQSRKESGAADALSSSKIIREAKHAKEEDPESLADKTHPPRVLVEKELRSKLGLRPVEYYLMTGGISTIYDQLTEEKGLAATVDAFDGKELKMTIPGTKISTDELTKRLMAQFGESLGLEKARTLIADPDVRATLESLLDIAMLRRDAYYSFVKIREENDPAKNSFLGYAAFDVVWTLDNTPDGSSNWYNFPDQIYRGFTFDATKTIHMGWNAMAKAPPVISDQNRLRAPLLDLKKMGGLYSTIWIRTQPRLWVCVSPVPWIPLISPRAERRGQMSAQRKFSIGPSWGLAL